jgi:transposase-like protein
MQLPIELSHPCYHDEDAARVQLESIRWPDGSYCPICGSFDRVKSLGGKSMGPGWYWCTPCRRKFTVRVGSIFERSHIPIHKWLLGFRLMAGSKKGFSAHQMHRTLKVDYKTAWFMEHRIRECMDESVSASPRGGEGKFVEADENYVGGRAKNRAYKAPPPKMAVFSLVERDGKARSFHACPVDTQEHQIW